METKSRYQVIADLEQKKSDLIRERDSADANVADKERNILANERNIEDIGVQKSDFDMNQENEKEDLERKKKEFDFKIKNTESIYKRKIEDAKTELAQFKETKETRKNTVDELIKGIDESLDRFGKLQAKQ